MFADGRTWDLKKVCDQKLTHVRMANGTQLHKNVPVVFSSHIIQDCDDMDMILKVLCDHRHEFDSNIEKYVELKQYRNDYTMVYYFLNKVIAGVSKRDFVEKKIWFKTDDEIFLYISSVPDSFYATPKKVVRGETILGYNKISRRKDGG